MKLIESFTINHLNLLRGIYVSRKDQVGDNILTSFDIRMKGQNYEPVMNTAEIHAIEHIGATFLRNHPIYSKQIIYFGPMGCRTGFYLILSKDITSEDIVPLVKEMLEYIVNFNGVLPGASAKECGNYLDMNLPMAKYEAKKYLNEVILNVTVDNLIYKE